MSFMKRFQKSFLSLLLIVTALVGSTGLITVLFQGKSSAEGADSSSTGPIFSFMSMSDTHSNTGNTVNAVRDAVANNINSMVLVGDITNYGDSGEYDSILNAINSVNNHPQMYYTIGNHEYDWSSDFNSAQNLFRQKAGITESTAYYSRKVQGYDFIFLGFDTKPTGYAYMSDAELDWLESTLAANAVPGKPIFLFNHQPIYQTVSRSYASEGYSPSSVNEQRFRDILEKYPQAILTSGHLHDDIKIPGNLYAGKFSAVRDGAVVNNQAMIFDVYKDKVHLKGRDVSTQQTIWEGTINLQPSTTEVYEAEDRVFTYATQRDDVNASGGKVVNMNDSRAYIESLKVDGGAAGGNKILKISYATDAANVTEGIYVNGVQVQNKLSFPTTGSMSSYSDLTVPIELNPGPNNKIVIQSDVTTAGINIDKLQIMDSATYSTMWGFNSNGNDSIPNGFGATLKGSAAYDTTDKMEGSASLNLNGADGNYASAGLVSTQTDDVTLTAWVKWNGATSGSQQILTNGDGLTNGYSIVLDRSKGDKVSIAVDGQTILGTQTALTAGQWTNVTAVRRGGAWELYVGGKSLPVTNNMAAPSTPTTGTYIGADSSGKQSFNGRIDAVRLYNQALSTDQISAIANETSTVKLQSIAITNPPTKLNYLRGDELALDGLVVTGTYNDGTTKVMSVTIDNITGYDNSILKAGQQVTVTAGGKIASFNVNTFDVLPGSALVPGRIEGSNYNLKQGSLIKIQSTTDGGPAYQVAYTAIGDWLEYNVDVTKSGSYQVNYRVSTRNSGTRGEVEFQVDGVPQKRTILTTSGWGDYRNISDTVALTQGSHKIRLYVTAADWNLRWFELTEIQTKTLNSITAPAAVTGLANGTAKTAAALGLPAVVSLVTSGGNVDASVTWDVNGASYDPTAVTGQTFTVSGTVTLPAGVANPNNVPLTTSISVTVIPAVGIPGKIEAENYSSMSGIKTEDSTEGTKDVGYTDPGDWMDYVVNVQKSALYKVDYRVAVNSGTGVVNLLVDGVSNKITSFPSTGGFQVWKTVSDKVYISAGKHTIRLAINTGGWNLNWFELSEAPPTNFMSITAPAAITGVPIGTAKTAAELGLPVKVSLVTDGGNVDASVIWDLNSVSYDPTATTAQTFTVPGTVTLPSGVANPNNVPLTTNISVSTKPAELVAYWKLNEGSGTTAGDSSGNGNAGTLVSNPTWTDSGKISGALAFNGGSRVEINPPATLNQVGDETVSLWFKTSQPATGTTSIFRQDKRFTALQLTGGNQARVAYWPSSSSNLKVLSFPWTYSDNNWHHYVATYDHALGLKIYVDGKVVASDATNLGLLPIATSKIMLGANETGGEAYSGLLDDVRVFNGMLSQAQVTQLMNEGQGPTLTNITAPAAVTGLPNGTAKTAQALGLPATVELVTNTGSVNANVAWNVDGSSYDPAVRTQQTFTVSGTVTLPAGVVNPNNVALTTGISVTVLPAPATPKSTLTGIQQVLSGQAFTLTMGLADVTQSVYQQVYAQDFTLQYDPASVQFDSVTSLKDGFRVIDTKETAPGQLRIVAATVGANVPAQGDMFAIQFKAKSVTQATNTTISVNHVKIANGLGNELQLGGASSEIQITVPAIPVDKAQLNATIASAQAKYNAAVEGGGDGQYVSGSKALLQSAIDAAKATVNNSNATQQQVDSAKAALEAAVEVFESKKIIADINGGGVSIGDLAVVAAAYGKQQGQVGWNEKADVNHDGKVDIVDLAIVAKAILQ